jgi:hypothetical protein
MYQENSMPDPHVQLLNLAVKAGRLAETMASDRQAEAKMFQRASELNKERDHEHRIGTRRG